MSTSPRQTAWIFPGQGSQYVGMGHDLAQAWPAVAALYAQADQILARPLSRLCFEGPEAELTQTVNAQPALLTTSVAVLLALGGRLDGQGRLQAPPQLPRPRFLAGHSLGEYSALFAAGALSFPDALGLVHERGRLMGQAHDGGMAAVIGLEEEILEEICQEYRQRGPLVIANYNSPGQLVLSGALQALEPAVAAARERGAKKVIPLKVSAAFHSPLMQQAAVGLAQAVEASALRPAEPPVIANASATPMQQTGEIRQELLNQVCSPVRWTASLHYMEQAGVQHFLEIGPGKVLTGLVRRTLSQASTTCLGTLEQVQSLLAASE
ncbi:MAG: ACP S-malonyltransferase [Chloroflexia bacterium]|nr:ACP S-malonyltransferase [Chloroflexia bacterium]